MKFDASDCTIIAQPAPRGQHTNEPLHGITVTHNLTRITVHVNAARSQHKNRAIAYWMIEAGLEMLEDMK